MVSVVVEVVQVGQLRAMLRTCGRRSGRKRRSGRRASSRLDVVAIVYGAALASTVPECFHRKIAEWRREPLNLYCFITNSLYST
jgi:hypothetical protein